MGISTRVGMGGVGLMAMSGCSGTTSVPAQPADEPAFQVAAKPACGCQVNATTGTFTNTVSGPEQGDTIQFTLSAAQKKTTGAGNVQGTSTFVNLDTGVTTRIKWTFIGCDQGSGSGSLNKQAKGVLSDVLNVQTNGQVDYFVGATITPKYSGVTTGTVTVQDLGQTCQ